MKTISYRGGIFHGIETWTQVSKKGNLKLYRLKKFTTPKGEFISYYVNSKFDRIYIEDPQFEISNIFVKRQVLFSNEMIESFKESIDRIIYQDYKDYINSEILKVREPLKDVKYFTIAPVLNLKYSEIEKGIYIDKKEYYSDIKSNQMDYILLKICNKFYYLYNSSGYTYIGWEFNTLEDFLAEKGKIESDFNLCISVWNNDLELQKKIDNLSYNSKNIPIEEINKMYNK